MWRFLSSSAIVEDERRQDRPSACRTCQFAFTGVGADISHPRLFLWKLPQAQVSALRNSSRSAINPGPIGSHLSFLRVCALEAGMSCPANIASQPK